MFDLSPPPRLRQRMRAADDGERPRYRLAASDLRLSAARGGGAPARLALSGLRRSRGGAPGGAIGARLDDLRGRCRRSRTPYGRSRALTPRSEEHTSELQSLMRISYAVFCLKKKQHNRSI